LGYGVGNFPEQGEEILYELINKSRSYVPTTSIPHYDSLEVGTELHFQESDNQLTIFRLPYLHNKTRTNGLSDQTRKIWTAMERSEADKSKKKGPEEMESLKKAVSLHFCFQ